MRHTIKIYVGLVVAIASATAHARLPRNVTRVPGDWGGSVSADGKYYAYWSDDGRLNVFDVDQRKVTVRHLPRGEGVGKLEFSHDGRQLAHILDGNLFVLHVASNRSRKIGKMSDFGYDGDDNLYYVNSGTLYRVGQSQPIARLPAHRASKARGGGPLSVWVSFGRLPVRAGQRRIVLACGRRSSLRRGCEKLWAIQMRTGTITLLVDHSKTENRLLTALVVSPDHERICYRDQGMRCVDTTTGRVRLVDRVDGTWGAVGRDWVQPFSPSGRGLVYFVYANGRRELRMFDSDEHKHTTVLAHTKFLDATWMDEEHLLLFEAEGTGPSPRKASQLVEHNIERGSQRVLVRDDTQYTVPVVLQGRRDILFVGRETGASRIHVRIETGLHGRRRPSR